MPTPTSRKGALQNVVTVTPDRTAMKKTSSPSLAYNSNEPVGTVELHVFLCAQGPSACDIKTVRCDGCLGDGHRIKFDALTEVRPLPSKVKSAKKASKGEKDG
jgi:hypothetical protein